MEPNISYSNIENITIEVLTSSEEFIDLTVEDDHTFFISNDDKNWILTHNSGMPDIDTDVSDRDKVLEVMKREFGDTNVVPISNYNLMKTKSLVKDLAKFYGVPFEEANRATATVEQEVKKATLKQGDDRNFFVLTYEDAMKHSQSFREFIEKHPQIGESMKVLFRQNRSLGRHAGGIIVSDNVVQRMPLIASKGDIQTPWTEGISFKHLEKIGNWVKYDVLGLETLRLFERTIELILKKRGNADPTFSDIRRWYDENVSIDKLDISDESVYRYVYHEARFPGVFQCTSPATQRFFVKARPSSIADIAALTAIYRPGPLGAHVDKLYLEAKHENKRFDWGDRRISELLKDTYGLLIFQEQVLLLAEKVAGFPKDKCDEVRRAITKRSSTEKSKDTIKEDFIKGSVANGYDEHVAKELYEKIAYFSNYAFNCIAGDSIVETLERGNIQIKDVIPGEHVKSQFGYVKVLNQLEMGKKQTYVITTKSGKTLRCTWDHQLMTPNGLKSIQEIVSQKLKKVYINTEFLNM